MRKCKISRINDGNPETLHNGDRLFMQGFPVADSTLEKYLNEGWEVKNMTPCYDPSHFGEGNYTFYLGGFLVYLEREE